MTLSATSGEALLYTFSRDQEEMEVYWSADAGAPRWLITCRGN